MKSEQPSLGGLTVKTIVAHTVTYFAIGLLAFNLFDYAGLFAQPAMAGFFRRVDDPLIVAGPLLQPIRGALFALAFYPLRDIFFGRRYGWLILWWLLVALGILSTFGPSPGSVEGLIYTRVSIADHLRGLPEVLLQSLLLSTLLYYWVGHPGAKWLTWTMGVTFAIAVLLPVLGLAMALSQ
jgi:hypothetical protein